MQLYRDYYHAYWEQKSAEFPGLERQFIFHDLRYARVFKQISEHFEHFSPNPLKEIIRERVSGRSFRIRGAIRWIRCCLAWNVLSAGLIK